MGKPVIVDAVRTRIGRKNGILSGWHPADLLGATHVALLERGSLRPADIDQVVTGCVTQVGEQAFNVGRTAWLAASFPYQTAATTVDCQCGSSLQANHLLAALITVGSVRIGIASGVESMSRVPIGANVSGAWGKALPEGFPHALPSQFRAAERIAEKRGIGREQADRFGLRSQELAAAATVSGAFTNEIAGPESKASDSHADEGLRETSLEALSALDPNRPGGIHTAGTTSQISDGAAAVLWMDEEVARAMGYRPRAHLRAHALVGADPHYHLEGPIDVTRHLLSWSGVGMKDLDVYEINEAFAAVPLAWVQELGADPERLNVRGGAIALGHPLGATGARLITTALNTLEDTDSELALIAMCVGGALGAGAILERLA